MLRGLYGQTSHCVIPSIMEATTSGAERTVWPDFALCNPVYSGGDDLVLRGLYGQTSHCVILFILEATTSC